MDDSLINMIKDAIRSPLTDAQAEHLFRRGGDLESLTIGAFLNPVAVALNCCPKAHRK